MRLPPTRLVLPTLVGVALLASAEPLVAQDGTGSLQVKVVSREDGRPLVGAHVVVQGSRIGAHTRADGSVSLGGMRPGTRTVEVQYLGYAPASARVTLEPGRISTVQFRLDVRPIQLAEVTVRARPSPRLQVAGFYQRRNSGLGLYMTREEIVATNRRTLSDLMRNVPGAAVYTGRAGLGSTRFRGGQSNCPVQFYVDGVRTYEFLIDELRVDDVEGLEIYRGAATLPPEYNSGSASCGVIVIWTRDSGGRGVS